MAQDDATDIFMVLIHDSGPIAGESTTQLGTDARATGGLFKDFAPGAMFEISKFDFGVGVEQQALEDALDPSLSAALARLPGMTMPTRMRKRPKAGDAPALDDSPVSIQPVNFTRTMDKASNLMLHHTIKRTFFKRAAIVKRKAAGGASAGLPYLRFDFKGVMLVSANWTNEEPIEETYSFHARAITMRYRPQLPDGSLGAAVAGFWSMAPNEKVAPL